jgi:hypothetical protein
MLPGADDQVRPLDRPGPEPESLRSTDGRRVITVLPQPDGSYDLVITSAGSLQAIARRHARTARRMITLAREWAGLPSAPGLAALAEAVRCHMPAQPGSRHGDQPVPVEMWWGPLGAAGECGWSVRFVTGLSSGGRTRRWGWAAGPPLTSALLAARDIQLGRRDPS